MPLLDGSHALMLRRTQPYAPCHLYTGENAVYKYKTTDDGATWSLLAELIPDTSQRQAVRRARSLGDKINKH